MVKNSFEWHNDWNKIRELLSKISDVVVAHDRYHDLLKYDEEYGKIMGCLTVNDFKDGYDQAFAKTINKLIEDYVSDEES